MTAGRLEELAGKCDAALAPDTPDIASILELADIADLARCALAWAKVEKTRGGALYVNQKTATWFDADNDHAIATTAIEAVEAAEVKP